MKPTNSYLRYSWFILVMVFLVIIAGGVVRMTQSGMGCPDWPTCFGRWIPPTSASQLPPDFEKYLKKQDIDHTFNVWHTWIEAINRYLGALLGVFIFIHFVWTVRKFWRNDKKTVWLSLLLLLAVGFQGWLGKKVVDHNLAVVKVTTHMLVALIIAAIPLLIIYRVKQVSKINDRLIHRLSIGVIALLLIQIALGTQVREQIDEIAKSLQYDQRERWLEQVDHFFLIHRSFSWVVLLACLFLWWKSKTYSAIRTNSYLVFCTVLATIGLGVIMAYASMPALAQPLHLTMASILIISVFSLTLRTRS